MNITLVSSEDQPLESTQTDDGLELVVKKGVSAQLYLNNQNKIDEYICNVTLEPKACLSIYGVSQLGDIDSKLTINSSIYDEAELNGVFLTHGTTNMKVSSTIDLIGEKARCRLAGLALIQGNEQVHHDITMNHNVGNCFSDQLFKNILWDKSIAQYSGLVTVKKGAQGTLSEQLNRNLLLSDSAKAISMPQLKIDADDVRCTHGSTTGAIDDTRLFYLMSRGYEEELARVVLMRGFYEDVLMRIEDTSIKTQLTDVCAQFVLERLQ